MDQSNPIDDQATGSAPQAAPTPEAPRTTDAPPKNKTMAVVAYIIFFIPLLTDAKNDPYVKYHVKQGLVLAILAILISVVHNILPYGLYWSTYWIFNLLNLGVFILFIIGILHASQDKQEPLPLIGQFADMFKF